MICWRSLTQRPQRLSLLYHACFVDDEVGAIVGGGRVARGTAGHKLRQIRVNMRDVHTQGPEDAIGGESAKGLSRHTPHDLGEQHVIGIRVLERGSWVRH